MIRLLGFGALCRRNESKALDKAGERLAKGGVDPAGKRSGQRTLEGTVDVSAGATARFADMDASDPQAITGLKFNVDLSQSPDDLDVLRELVLKIYWDGESKPSVCAPLPSNWRR